MASNANCNSAESGSNTCNTGEDQQRSRVVPEEVVGVIRTVVTELWDQLQQQQQRGGGGSGVTTGTNPARLAPGGPSVDASSGETPTPARAAGPSSSGECVWCFSCNSINPR